MVDIKVMDTDKMVLMMNTFVKSQFSYCPLIWMYHNRCIHNKVNEIYERALPIAYKDSHSCFESRVERNSQCAENMFPLFFTILRNNSVSLHQLNLQLLLVEIF